jgi:asparagine synthase (glutamine-hydrolysing)
MRSLLGDLLPGEVIARRDKADMEDAFWGERSRRFVDEWDGSGVDESLADVDALRAAWRARNWSSVTLLQLAWLASARRLVPGR